MTRAQLEALAQAVGYRWGDQSRLLVERALERVAKALNLMPADAAAQVLARAPNAWRTFSDAVAIHETYFFRHPEHFALVEKLAVDRSVDGAPVTSAWSVGCSTGEELWSLALTLWPHAPALRVAGSDLSNEALLCAQRARYADRSFRDGSSRRHPCLLQTPGGFEVSERLRERAVFGQLNLAADPVRPPPGMAQAVDVIFCRNVLVYLRPEVCSAVLSSLAGVLSEDGLLIIGAVEVPGELPSGLEPADESVPGALRRVSTKRAPTPRAARRPALLAPRDPAAPTVFADGARARTVAPMDPRVQSARGLADEGRLDEALAAAESMKEVPTALFLAASIHLERGDLARATASLHLMVRAQPDSVPAHLQLALVAQRRGDSRAAQRHRTCAQRLLESYRDEDDLDVEGMKASWARQVLSSMGAEAER